MIIDNSDTLNIWLFITPTEGEDKFGKGRTKTSITIVEHVQYYLKLKWTLVHLVILNWDEPTINL